MRAVHGGARRGSHRASRSEPGERAALRLLVHDYCGHPFQVELSRELARRGHAVLHAYCPSETSGKGALRLLDADPPNFAVEPVPLARPFEKYRAGRRILQEREYARAALARLGEFRPHVVVSGNTPLVAQALLLTGARRRGARTIYWQQDQLGVGAQRVLRDHFGRAGGALGSPLVLLERRLLRSADAVVAICDDFRPALAAAGVPARRVAVIENWAPVPELPVHPRDNPWAREHGLVGRTVFLYAGTIGLKHDPALLLELARHWRERTDVRVVVVSEGLGAGWLRARVAEEHLENIVLLGYQPYDRLPEVLASADVLVAMLGPAAATFSVPSKVLTYLCASRAVLAAIPERNPAARVVRASGSGVVVDPMNRQAFLGAADRLAAAPELRAAYGAAARRHAERAFRIDGVADRFEAVLTGISSTSSTSPGKRAWTTA